MIGCLGLDCFEGLGVYRPPCRSDASCDLFKRQAEIYQAKGDRIRDAGYAELAKKFYALADQAKKRTSGCCKPGESPEERQKEWAEKREKYKMTPDELEKAKDQIDISYEKTRQLYQRMIDEGKSYHGMTPAQLRKWIADIPRKIAEKVKALERNPYKPMYELTGAAPAISPALRAALKATPADSLDFSIDKKTGQVPPPRSWDPYKPTPTTPELTPAETPEDRRIPTTPASPATPSVRPAISPMLKATTFGSKASAITGSPAKTASRKTSMSGLGCMGLGCMGAMTSDQKTKAASMQMSLNNYLVRLRAYKNTSAATDVEDAERILTNGVDKFWSDVNQYEDWDTALNTYRGLTKIAEDAIVVAQNKIPYSAPLYATTAPASQTQVANAVASQAMQNAQAVAQQSSAVQASYAPYVAPQYMGMMMAAAQTQAVAEQQAAQRAAEKEASAKRNRTLLIAGGAVAGLALLYFAFKAKG